MNEASFVLVLSVALIAPLLSLWARWKVPLVIVEILTGLVIGNSFLRLLEPTDPTLAFLAGTVGFALVMFVAGTRVPVKTPGITRALRTGASRAVAIGVLSVPAGIGVAHIFGTQHAALYAVLIASSSAAVAMPVLSRAPKGKGYLELIAQIAVADVTCIVALPLALEPSGALQRSLGLLTVTFLAGLVFVILKNLKIRESVGPSTTRLVRTASRSSLGSPSPCSLRSSHWRRCLVFLRCMRGSRSA